MAPASTRKTHVACGGSVIRNGRPVGLSELRSLNGFYADLGRELADAGDNAAGLYCAAMLVEIGDALGAANDWHRATRAA